MWLIMANKKVFQKNIVSQRKRYSKECLFSIQPKGSVLIENEKMEKFEQKLKTTSKTKSQWLNEKIDEELKG